MKRIIIFRSALAIFILLMASLLYAGALSVVPTPTDITWPLLFNAIAPGAIIAYAGKRYIDKQDKINQELIGCKNDHENRIGKIEKTHELLGCDQPGRRKDDIK